ncbi:nuclear transport factor 2 family protein [Eoetvoesiella caeni]
MIQLSCAEHSTSYINVARLMARYANYLDKRDLSAWASLFSDEASYSVASSENVNAGWPLLLLDDDSKSKIDDRVRFVREFWEGHYNDYLSRHVMSTPLIIDTEGHRVRFEQNFSLYMTETDAASDKSGMSSLLGVGHYAGEVSAVEGHLKLTSLCAYLDTCVLTSALVYPV